MPETLDGARETHQAEAETRLPVTAIGIGLGGERRCAGDQRTRVEMLAGELRRCLTGTGISISEAKADGRRDGEHQTLAQRIVAPLAVGVGHRSPPPAPAPA